MNTTSLWQQISRQSAAYPKLTHDIEVDVAIIGGGITGVTAAAQLLKAGKKVAILEAKRIGGVTTGSSTGNLYIAVQPSYQAIHSKFNLETVKAIAHSRKFAIDFIENQIRENQISCQFKRRPWYAYTENNARISLEREVELLKQIGISIEYTQHLPLPLPFKKAVVMEDQARFNPLQYVISLAEALSKQNCLIFENTRVIDWEEKEVCTLKTENAKVIAKKVFMATHTPIGVNPTQLFTAPYRSYVVAVHMSGDQYPEGHFWDLDRPPHATCTHAVTSDHPELLLVAGSHHKTGQGSDMTSHYYELEAFLRQHFAVSEVAYQWSAQHYQGADDVPYIGLASRCSKHTYLATGYFADGLVYGTLAGVIIADTLLEKDNALINTYQSNRCTFIPSVNFLVKENANLFLQYLKDFPLFDSNYNEIQQGEGKVVEINREKLAVSRDENNQLHFVSAVCTHMKCIVNWNGAEKTWDCPCHGSRFTHTGKVIEGPALLDLESKHPHQK